MTTYCCAHCFYKSNYADRMCLNPNCELPDHRQSEFQAKAGNPSLVVRELATRASDGRLACPKCGNPEQFVEVCQNCRSKVSAPNGDVLTVSFTGARNSGKTVYMVALVETLRRYATMNQGTFQEVGPTKQIYEEMYYNRLFKENQVLDATTKDRQKELVFRLSRRNDQDVFLLFRDVAGERIQEVDSADPELDYLNNSDLVAFMYDPYTIAPLMDALRGIVSDTRIQGKQGASVIDSVLTHLIRRDNEHTNVALLFGKFDVVHRLSQLKSTNPVGRFIANPGLSYMVDDTFTPSFKWTPFDTEMVDSDVRALMTELHGAEMLNAAENPMRDRPDQLRAFAVSALGQPPEGTFLEQSGVSPFRCLDPIFWAYHRTFNKPLM